MCPYPWTIEKEPWLSWQNNAVILVDEKFKRFELECAVDLRKPYHAVFTDGGIMVADSHQRQLFLRNPNSMIIAKMKSKVRIIARLDIKAPNLIKGINLEECE